MGTFADNRNPRGSVQTGALAYRLAASAMVLVAVAATATSVEARIKCRGDLQVVNGQLIATPYCEDQYLAKVARTYGMRTSANRIRNNPNYKREVCRLVRNDIRVQEQCNRILPTPRSGW